VLLHLNSDSFFSPCMLPNDIEIVWIKAEQPPPRIVIFLKYYISLLKPSGFMKSFFETLRVFN